MILTDLLLIALRIIGRYEKQKEGNRILYLYFHLSIHSLKTILILSLRNSPHLRPGTSCVVIVCSVTRIQLLRPLVEMS